MDVSFPNQPLVSHGSLQDTYPVVLYNVRIGANQSE